MGKKWGAKSRNPQVKSLLNDLDHSFNIEVTDSKSSLSTSFLKAVLKTVKNPNISFNDLDFIGVQDYRDY